MFKVIRDIILVFAAIIGLAVVTNIGSIMAQIHNGGGVKQDKVMAPL